MTYFLKGAIHIHTTCSDGSGDISEISRSAKMAGLDWLIITDHNNMDVKEGIYNGVYVIVGEEISPSYDANHCMAFGLKNNIENTENPEVYLQEVKKQGAFSCICHPHESLNRKNPYKPIRWKYDDLSLIDGVELWNYFSNWTDLYNDKNVFSQAYYYLFGNFMKNEPKKETLELWDRMNFGSDRVKFAIGGLDAHKIQFRKFFLKFPVYPYYIMFKTIVNVIPSKDKPSENFEEAKEFILNSLKAGRHFISDRRRCNNCEVLYSAHNKDLTCLSGETLELDDDCAICVELPEKAEIRLIKDGVLWLTERKKERAFFRIKYPGKYRVEVYKKSNGWIFTNPIIFKEKGEKKWI